MTLIRVGFFRELGHGRPDGPSLPDSIGPGGPGDDAIVRYLNAGVTLAATGSMVDDCLDGSRKAVARLEIATDGQWVWPRDLAYYVAEYHVRLPAAFVEHMRENTWAVPEFTSAEMERLETDYLMST